MPRTRLVHFASDAPLTVTAAAEILGISASTLRSWDRRYGLGPSGHQSGSKRLYRGEDIARLERMLDLIQAGMPTKDAAQAVSEVDWESLVVDQGQQLTVAELKSLSRTGGEPLQRALEVEFSREGLMHTWGHLIEPTLKELQEETGGFSPTESPLMQVYAAVVQVLQGLVGARGEGHQQVGARVTLLVREYLLVLGNVVSTALWWQGVDTRILRMPDALRGRGMKRFTRHTEEFDPEIIILLGQYDLDGDLIEGLVGNGTRHLILVSEHLPSVVHPKLQRVRTAAAGVEEALMISNELRGWSS